MNHRTNCLKPTLALLAGISVLASGCAKGHRDPARVSAADEARIAAAHAAAYEAAHQSDPARAVRGYEEAVGRYDDFPAAWNNLGVSLMKQGKYLEAEQAFTRAAEQSRTDPRPLYNRGLLWMTRSYPADARVHFKGALERDPYYLPALRGAVECDIQLRETTDETLDNIRRALMLERDPKWLERLRAQRVKIQSGLAKKELPRSLQDMDAPLAPEPMPGREATDDEKRVLENAVAPAPH